MTGVTEVGPGIFAIDDTCTVYAVRGERDEGFLVDFGSGKALDLIADCGIDRVTHVLMTHHHRDQGQGLHLAQQAGIEIIVPPLERELFDDVEHFWQHRRVHNDYVMTSDRESLTRDVRVGGTAPEYRHLTTAGVRVLVQPTPGHTIGSVSYLLEREGLRYAFTGDLIHSPGRVHSLANLQWTYTGNEGIWMCAYSCLALQRVGVDMLLPSHGTLMPDASAALDLLVDNLQDYLATRRPEGPVDIRARFEQPYVRLSEHLLWNTSSDSNSYVLLSDSGAALVIDYGYDMTGWFPLGGPRFTQRPWLESIPVLKRDFGVAHVEVALPTHYHDDHCAGMNLLREVEGTQVWVPENVVDQMTRPLREDLPCQWYEPIPADRVLPLGESFGWHEYTITVHPLPGHTRYAAAFEFDVDGVTVVATGDQWDMGFVDGARREILNYQYRNQVSLHDYRHSAALLARIAPGLLVSGHWGSRDVDEAYLAHLRASGEEMIGLHERLLPHPGIIDSRLVRLRPYHRLVRAGERVEFEVVLRNPAPEPLQVRVELIAGDGVEVSSQPEAVLLPARGESIVCGSVTMSLSGPRRSVVVADVWMGAAHQGQVAEAIVERSR